MSTQKPAYPMLEAEIAKNGVKKKDIAEKLGIAPRSLSKKLVGEIDFWWTEIQIIHGFFPDVPIEKLFSTS